MREGLADIDHAKQRSGALIEQAKQALTRSIAINQALEAERDVLPKRVKETGDQCTELRFQLRQVDKLNSDLATSKELAEGCRVQCEALTTECFALKSVSDGALCRGAVPA